MDSGLISRIPADLSPLIDKYCLPRSITSDDPLTNVSETFPGRLPGGICVSPEGKIIFVDICVQLKVIEKTGETTVLACTLPKTGIEASLGSFGSPSSLCTDAQGNIFVCDPYYQSIWKRTPDGTTTIFAGAANEGFTDGHGQEALFRDPTSLCLDKDNNLIVCDFCIPPLVFFVLISHSQSCS